MARSAFSKRNPQVQCVLLVSIRIGNKIVHTISQKGDILSRSKIGKSLGDGAQSNARIVNAIREIVPANQGGMPKIGERELATKH
jgi:hypothetical protein